MYVFPLMVYFSSNSSYMESNDPKPLKVIGLVDGGLYKDFSLTLYLRDGVGKLPLSLLDNDNLEILVSIRERFNALIDTNLVVDSEIEDYNLELREDIQTLSHIIDRRLYRDLFNHRIEMHLVLNCSGGLVHLRDQLMDFADLIRSRSGKVIAYSQNKALSTGANLLSVADERYMVEGTDVMWHMPRFADHSFNNQVHELAIKNALAALRLEDCQLAGVLDFLEYEDFLIRSCFPSKRDEMIRLISGVLNDFENTDNELNFTAQTLADFGVVKLVKDPAVLRELFLEKTGMSGNELARAPRLRNFFPSQKVSRVA
jgi:ATP-dependent protease ClpP protease subunit